jgi:hypothetical protein
MGKPPLKTHRVSLPTAARRFARVFQLSKIGHYTFWFADNSTRTAESILVSMNGIDADPNEL